MFLEITTTHRPATDLGFLLGKHPERLQSRDLSFGRAHVFYPEASVERCTAVLLLEIDSIDLTRSASKNYADSFQLGHYINDRPYAASSFLTTAIAKVYGSALNGNCRDRPELAQQPLPLEVTLAALPSGGGEELIRRFFEPLGYEVQVVAQALDQAFPSWGQSPYYKVQLKHTLTLQELLTHLYILIPALDNNKHYYVGNPEVDKLMAKAASWLENHPAVRQITHRYLKHQKNLAELALEKLITDETNGSQEKQQHDLEKQLEEKISLHQLRHQRVLQVLKDRQVSNVLDLGCGSGKLLKQLLADPGFARITGLDVNYRSLELARRRLHWDTMTPRTRERIELLHGALTYRDERLEGYDAAVAVEVIEHLDAGRLQAFEQCVFQYAKPEIVVITTPNAEYNVLFDNLPAGAFRHSDHRFEWTRLEMEAWAQRIAKAYGYQVSFDGIGPGHEAYGCPSQMAVFYK